MVLPINTGPNPLATLLTDVNRQARGIAFNIQFNNLQNTVLDRINKETQEIANVEGNQRELDELNKVISKLVEHRKTVVAFAYTNESNDDRFEDIASKATSALAFFSLGDADVSNLSESEKSTYETNLASIVDVSDLLVELSHPDIIDGNNVTRLRSQIDALRELTPEVGAIDDEGTDPATNDNLAIKELLSEIATSAGVAAESSATLQVLAAKTIQSIDLKLREADKDRLEVSVLRTGEIEYELQVMRSKYATLLRSIELSFETSAQATDALANALDIGKEPELGSILSILS